MSTTLTAECPRSATPMAFERIFLVETLEQERERLAASPEGSKSRWLSTLPVTIPEWPQDMLIELPWTQQADAHRVVVVPIEHRGDPLAASVEGPRRRHGGSWACIVVASDHLKYPVGGHRLAISGAELARGHRIDLIAARSAS